METTENNKLIAEFMGAYSEENGFDYTKIGNKGVLYHKSWDWLMPVAQKIKDTPSYGSTDGLDFSLTNDLTIESLYESVVEFIKYQNEEKN